MTQSREIRNGVQAHLDPEIRELIRRERESVDMEYTLQEREDCVRLTLPQIAHERFSDIPDTVEMCYFPDEHALLIDLPDPEPGGDAGDG